MQSYRLEQFGSLDHLILQNEEIPQPGTGEVLVRVRASALNYRDLALLHGEYPMSCRPGLVPLSDGSGEIVAVGGGVSRFRVGDRVTNTFFPNWMGGRFPVTAIAEQYGSDRDGWLTEYKVVSQEALVSIPEYLSFEAAATLPCAAVTAWSALAGPAPVSPGDTVLTLGSGGVSLFAIQLAKLRGARVIATTSSSEKAQRLKAMGADEVINYNEVSAWGEKARELTGGRGVDRVVEVGGAGTLEQSLGATTIGGEIAVIGFVATGPADIPFSSLYGSGASLRRNTVGSREEFEDLNRALEKHQLHPVVDRVVPFDKAREAWEHFDSRRHFGKVVIRH